MLYPGVTQEWVDEGELPSERTKYRRWRRPYDVLAEATHGEVVVRVHHTRICMIRVAGELNYFSAHIRLREPGKSEDKAEVETFVEPSIPSSHGGRALVVKRGRGGGEYKGKLQVLRHGERAEAKELHKTGVDELLIKVAESEGLWVDAGVPNQGIK
ncbi:hypothetical protein BHM03_00046112 [Ensete ventricosum]|nr:hypothetical protein BHM03_00046112 [Ensete ventricosum]